jgi:hypothetical protein
MRHAYILCFILILNSTCIPAQIIDWNWVKLAGNNSQFDVTGSAIDKHGNTYITGYFYDMATFDTTVIQGSFYAEIYIAKYDSLGNLLWVKKAGGADNDYGEAISVDDFGNCYVTGEISGSADFDNIHCVPWGTGQVFIAKYSSAGQALWVKYSSGSDFCVASDIFTDSIGNSYITGYFQNQFDMGNLTSTGLTDSYMIKYDSTGQRKWIKQITGTDNQIIRGIQADGAGNCFVTGEFNSSSTFGTLTISSQGNFDVFVAKLNSSGNWEWAKSAGGAGDDRAGIGKSISVDPFGNSYITGYVNSTAHFGTHIVTVLGQTDAFIAKCDPQGNFKWVQKSGGLNNNETGNSIATNRLGESYVISTLQDTVTIGGATHYLRYKDIVIAKYDSLGVFNWVKTVGGYQGDHAKSILLDKNNNVFVSGKVYVDVLNDTCYLDNSFIISNHSQNAFIAKLSDPILTSSENNISFTDNQFLVYPNPVKSELTISFVEKIVRIEILNAFGVCVFAGEEIRSPFIKNLEGWAEGVYYIKLSGERDFRITKILKF